MVSLISGGSLSNSMDTVSQLFRRRSTYPFNPFPAKLSPENIDRPSITALSPRSLETFPVPKYEKFQTTERPTQAAPTELPSKIPTMSPVSYTHNFKNAYWLPLLFLRFAPTFCECPGSPPSRKTKYRCFVKAPI